jgi:hypothetical protein
MNRVLRYRRKTQLYDGEEILFAHACSWAPRDRWLSFVGGEILVTTHRIIFTPNVFAAVLRRAPWVHRIAEIEGTQIDMLEARRPFGTLPVLRILVAAEPHSTKQTRTVVMSTSDLVADLAAWINRTQWTTDS